MNKDSMKLGDFVSVPTDYDGRLIGVVERIVGPEVDRYRTVSVRCIDGRGEFSYAISVHPAPLEEVWRALEDQQSEIEQRFADLQKLKTKAFERALQEGTLRLAAETTKKGL